MTAPSRKGSGTGGGAARRGDFASFMETSFSEEDNRAVRRLARGEAVEGTVVQIGGDSVFVDIGARSDGRIPRVELENRDGEVTVTVGDRVRATVVDSGASGGPLLTVALGREEVDFGDLQLALDNRVPVEGRFTRAVGAGLEVEVGGVRAFCPASQVEIGYTKDLQAYQEQRSRFLVLEIRDGGRSVVVSRRAVLEQEREDQAQALRARLQVGQDLTGVVRTIQKYGAFVDLGGIEGLLHISELIHGRVERVEDVVQTGETVRVRVLAIEETDRGTRISLSMKALQEIDDTADGAGSGAKGKREGRGDSRAIAADEVLDGRVSRAAPFGIFVDTDRGEGLVPVQELDLPPGSDHRRAYPVGKEVQVVLLERDPASGRLRFSVSGVNRVAERKSYQRYSDARDASAAAGGSGLGSLGDLLRKKLGLPDPPPAPKPEPRSEPRTGPEPAEAPGPIRSADPVEPPAAPPRSPADSSSSAAFAAPKRTAPEKKAPARSRKPTRLPPGVTRRRDPGKDPAES